MMLHLTTLDLWIAALLFWTLLLGVVSLISRSQRQTNKQWNEMSAKLSAWQKERLKGDTEWQRLMRAPLKLTEEPLCEEGMHSRMSSRKTRASSPYQKSDALNRSKLGA